MKNQYSPNGLDAGGWALHSSVQVLNSVQGVEPLLWDTAHLPPMVADAGEM